MLVNWVRYELCKDISSEVTYDEFKENIWWFKDGESEKLCTGRDALIHFGEQEKAKNPTVWIDKLVEKIVALHAKGEDKFVISDFRYPIERVELERWLGEECVAVHFCDYKSDRYDDEPRIDNMQALTLRDVVGCEDGDLL